MPRRWIEITALAGALALVFLTRAEQNSPGTTTAAKATTDSTRAVVIKLRHAGCTEALDMLRQLLHGQEAEQVNIAADPRTNTLVLRGPQEQIESVSKLIVQIDDEPSAPTPASQPASALVARFPSYTVPGPQASPYAPSPQRAVSVDTPLVGELMQLEQQSFEAAQAYRTAAAATPTDKKRLDTLRQRLVETVQQAFDKRQLLQQLEVAQLKERLQKVEQTLAKRGERRPEIVQRRIEELLDEDQDLQWDAAARRNLPATGLQYVHVPVTEEVVTSDGKRQQVTRYVVTQQPVVPPRVATNPAAAPAALAPRAPTAALPGAPAIAPAPAVTALPGLPGSVAPPAVVAGPPAVATQLPANEYRTYPGSPAGSPPASSASSVRRELAEAEHAFAQAKSTLARLQKLQAKRAVSATEYQAEQEQLGHAQRRLDLARREFEAQAKLLELDVAQAKSRVEEATSHLSETKERFTSGAATTGEVRKLHAELDQARLQLERAQTLLDLHRSAASAADTSKAAADGDAAKAGR